VKAGRDVSALSVVKDEREVLFLPGSKFDIQSFKDDDDLSKKWKTAVFRVKLIEK
jgi:hypothetical protein